MLLFWLGVARLQPHQDNQAARWEAAEMRADRAGLEGRGAAVGRMARAVLLQLG